jgi:hypothetical protein
MLTAKRCGIRPCHLILALQMTPQTGSEPASSAAHPTVSDLRSSGMNQGRAMSASEGSTYQYAYVGEWQDDARWSMTGKTRKAPKNSEVTKRSV